MIEATTILLEPLQFPLQWSVHTEALRRQDIFLMKAAYNMRTTQPGATAVQAELLVLHDQISSYLQDDFHAAPESRPQI
jgi:hypothetical protein